MKIIGYICFAFLCSLPSFAHTADSLKLKKHLYYVGLRLNKAGYNLHFHKLPYHGYLTAFPVIYVGYHLTKRSAIQIGLTYGRRKIKRDYAYDNEEGKLMVEHNYMKVTALLYL